MDLLRPYVTSADINNNETIKSYDDSNLGSLFQDICEYCKQHPLELGYKVNIPGYGVRYLRPEPKYWSTI